MLQLTLLLTVPRSPLLNMAGQFVLLPGEGLGELGDPLAAVDGDQGDHAADPSHDREGDLQQVIQRGGRQGLGPGAVDVEHLGADDGGHGGDGQGQREHPTEGHADADQWAVSYR
jgi:hypothetical protein